MKKDLHPKYYTDADISCSCGAVFITGSTSEKSVVESCSECHPFYTGKQKIIDSAGRVDRFEKLREKAKEIKKSRKNVKSKEEKRLEREKNKESKKN